MDGGVRARITGRVQGVGYRFFAHQRAVALGLVGYVRNLPDGGVEVVALGPGPALTQLLDELRRGPRGAMVRGCVVEPYSGVEAFASFDVLH